MIQDLLNKYGTIDDIIKAMENSEKLNQELRNEYSKQRSIVRKRIERVNKKYGESNSIPKSLKDIPYKEHRELLFALSDVETQKEHPNAYNSITQRKQDVNTYIQILEQDVKERPFGAKLEFDNEFMEKNFGDLMALFKSVYGEDVFNYIDSNRVVAWFEATKYMTQEERAKELTKAFKDSGAFSGMVMRRHPVYERDARTKTGYKLDDEGNRIRSNFNMRERTKEFKRKMKSIAGETNGVKSKAKLKR